MRKSYWSKLDFRTAPYHWGDHLKKSNDYNYLYNLYEELLLELVLELNNYHGVNHTERYWRIVIGPWLERFIIVIFDRWSMLNIAINDYNITSCNIIKRDKNSALTKDIKDFFNCINGDDWNEAIFAELLNLIPNNIELNIVSDDGVLAKRDCSYINLFIKTTKKILTNIIGKVNNLFNQERDIFCFYTYVPFVYNLKLQIANGQFPQIWFSVKHSKYEGSLVDRPITLKRCTTNDEFRNILYKILVKHIPVIYIENYKSLVHKSKNMPWPDKPKTIFTSNSIWEDDLFKVWAAHKVENGSIMVLGQHGGHYGSTSLFFSERHEFKISNKWLSWGWSDDNEDKVIPVGNIKVIGKKQKHNSNGVGLIVGLSIPRFFYQMQCLPMAEQYLSYLEDQFDFYDYLPVEIQREIIIKLGGEDHNWSTKVRWEDRFKDVNIYKSNHSFNKIVRDSRVVISTYNATTFLETLALNVPTVIFWSPNIFQVNNDFENDLKLLMSAGIFHASPKSAAIHLQNIWNNVDGWWYSKNTQKSRKEFCEKWSNVDVKTYSNIEKVVVG